MSRATLNLALLAAAILLGSIAVWQLRTREVAPVAAPDRSDYVLRDFQLVTLNAEGKESFTVRGPYLQRDIAGKSLSLVKPRFTFPHTGGGRWNASSEAAWVSPDADQVHLLRDVVMVGPPSATGVSNRLETARLLVLPDVEQASTDSRVTITQGDSILEGTGLRADMKAKRFDLLNQVKGSYASR